MHAWSDRVLLPIVEPETFNLGFSVGFIQIEEQFHELLHALNWCRLQSAFAPLPKCLLPIASKSPLFRFVDKKSK